MPRSIELKPVSDTKPTGKIRRFSAKYPKESVTRPELRKSSRSWQSQQTPPKLPPIKARTIKAVRFTTSDLGKLRAISESPTPTAEAIVRQKMNTDQILGTLYSALTALEFTKMESEYKRRMASATASAARTRVQSEWAQVVKAVQQVYASAGLKRLKETDLRDLSQELRKNKANFNALATIANSAVPADASTRQPLDGKTVVTGGWVPQTAVFPDLGETVSTIPGLCDKPFVEGVFTKTFSRSFDWTVHVDRWWCPKWTDPFRLCPKDITLAGASFSMSLEVGYRVTCCGATAWGQGNAEACGTVLGFSACADCTAKITGVTGIGRSATGSNCTYGIGLIAEAKCTFLGETIFEAKVPFGYTVNGPCPLLGLCDNGSAHS